ncbi:MAG: serpin family protein [Synergistaceae bacterium]|nr:serpin family protein [Synergistaceae bacterium]
MRGEVYVPDEPPGWEGKISQSDIKKIRMAGVSINRFAFDLYPLMAADIRGNILFSPYNLVMTLVNEYKAANERTRGKLRRVLRIDGSSIKNFALLDRIIKNTPEDRGEVNFDGKKTYFKADWEFPFYNYEWIFKIAGAAKPRFYKADGEICTVDIMKQNQRLKYYEDERIKSFEFPFVDRYYSYIIILPKRQSGVRGVEISMSYEKYLDLLAKQADKNLEVQIVDTKITALYDFSCWLNTLGINGLKGEKLEQKSVLDIYGGEQSRAVETRWPPFSIINGRFMIVPPGTPPSPQEIEKRRKEEQERREERNKRYNVDRNFYPTHPFVYFIVDNRSGAILLMGRYCGKEDSPNIVSK